MTPAHGSGDASTKTTFDRLADLEMARPCRPRATREARSRKSGATTKPTPGTPMRGAARDAEAEADLAEELRGAMPIGGAAGASARAVVAAASEIGSGSWRRMPSVVFRSWRISPIQPARDTTKTARPMPRDDRRRHEAPDQERDPERHRRRASRSAAARLGRGHRPTRSRASPRRSESHGSSFVAHSALALRAPRARRSSP